MTSIPMPDRCSGRGSPLPRETLIPCQGCQKPFQARRPSHRFCSDRCRVIAFQQKREKQRRERDSLVRIKLKEALALLADEPPPHTEGDQHAD